MKTLETRSLNSDNFWKLLGGKIITIGLFCQSASCCTTTRATTTRGITSA